MAQCAPRFLGDCKTSVSLQLKSQNSVTESGEPPRTSLHTFRHTTWTSSVGAENGNTGEKSSSFMTICAPLTLATLQKKGRPNWEEMDACNATDIIFDLIIYIYIYIYGPLKGYIYIYMDTRFHIRLYENIWTALQAASVLLAAEGNVCTAMYNT